MKKVILLLPLFFVVLLSIFLFIFLIQNKNPTKPPSALLNKDLPTFSTKSLYNKYLYLSSDNLKKKYTLINFFASWCIPCRAEHNLFFEIKKNHPDLFLLGIAHKDDPSDSKQYLSEKGNPYSFVGLDHDGKIALEFGVFGLPETFIINSEGQIIYKHLGPLTKKIVKNEIKPLL